MKQRNFLYILFMNQTKERAEQLSCYNYRCWLMKLFSSIMPSTMSRFDRYSSILFSMCVVWMYWYCVGVCIRSTDTACVPIELQRVFGMLVWMCLCEIVYNFDFVDISYGTVTLCELRKYLFSRRITLLVSFIFPLCCISFTMLLWMVLQMLGYNRFEQ